ncbi:MAG: hypothetical protein V2A65_04220 [Candidatus Omnitrophota bacterium]
MQNLLEELKKLLEQDERLVVDGKLLKNKIIESALKLDAKIKEYECQVDRMIYKLYDLTKEEIAIVEQFGMKDK